MMIAKEYIDRIDLIYLFYLSFYVKIATVQWSNVNSMIINVWEYIHTFQIAYTDTCYCASIIDFQEQNTTRDFNPLLFTINKYSNTSCRIAALCTKVVIIESYSPTGVFGKFYAIGV